MESVETRKLGKHLFIFEKGKAKNGKGKAKDRTLITSCQTEDGDNKLPPEFVKYMRTLFDILDEKNTGFVKLNDLEACWGKNNGDSSSHGTGVLEQLRRISPANGLISFDLLCMGFGQALHSKEGVSIRNGSTGQNPELRPASRNGFVINQTLTEQRSAVPAVAQVNKQQDTISFPVVPGKFGEFSKRNEIRESTVPKSEKGLNHKSKTEQKRPKSMGHKTNDLKKSVHWSTAINDSYRYGIERRSRPMSMGSFGQPQEETTHLYPSQTNSHISRKNSQNPEHELCKTDAVFIPKPEVRRRPRSMVHFGEQKRAVDLSVAKKEGGILEGLQKTDKKAVIDKLKQWRNEELKKGGQGKRGVTKEPYRVAHGYLSDNEGNRIMRHKSAVAPACHLGNDADFERQRGSTHSSSKINGEQRSPKTTVYYQGQIRNKAETSDSSLKIAFERREERKTIRDTKSTKDVSRLADEFHILKEGLRIVDEVRDCLVKRIADIQEQKLYAQLNNVSSDKTGTSHDQDVDSITSEERKSIGKAHGVLFDSSHIESLTAHFKGLKTVLGEVKKPKTDR